MSTSVTNSGSRDRRRAGSGPGQEKMGDADPGGACSPIDDSVFMDAEGVPSSKHGSRTLDTDNGRSAAIRSVGFRGKSSTLDGGGMQRAGYSHRRARAASATSLQFRLKVSVLAFEQWAYPCWGACA